LSDLKEIGVEPNRLRESSLSEYIIRFLFGGIISGVIGVIGPIAGPIRTGLFLAFPAVLPASLTLIESEQGKKPAGRNAFGAAFGSVGLIAFAGIVWVFATRAPAWIVLGFAILVWFAVSTVVWMILGEMARRPGQDSPR
jgi:Protein of unknown function (DUF3147)